MDGDPCKFALTSKAPSTGGDTLVLHSSHPGVCQVWVLQISQILENQRGYLNGTQSERVGGASGTPSHDWSFYHSVSKNAVDQHSSLSRPPPPQP